MGQAFSRVTLLLSLFVLSSAAHADQLVLTIDNTEFTAIPNGSTTQDFAVTGTIYNPNSFSVRADTLLPFPIPIFGFNVGVGFDLNDSGGVEIAAGATTADIALLTISVSPGASPAQGDGQLLFQSPITITSNFSNISSNTITVTVTRAVPEPSCLLLLCTGLIGGSGMLRRRLFR